MVVDSLMDMSRPIGKMDVKTRIPVPDQTKDVTELLAEIVANADIVGHNSDGCTVYLMHLSPASADILASLFADDEHDGREPDPKDVR